MPPNPVRATTISTIKKIFERIHRLESGMRSRYPIALPSAAEAASQHERTGKKAIYTLMPMASAYLRRLSTASSVALLQNQCAWKINHSAHHQRCAERDDQYAIELKFADASRTDISR